MPRGFRNALSLVLMLVLTWLAPRLALAQAPTTTIGANVTQLSPGMDDGTLHKHPTGLLVANINRQDCLDDNSLRFPLSFTGVPTSSYDFQVWAGAGECQDATTRASTTATCWPLYTTTPNIASTSVTIRVRDIVAHRLRQPAPTVYAPAGIEACDSQTDSTGEKTVNLSFMWLSGTTVASTQTYAVKADLVGPNPPSGVSVGVDDTRLVVKWTPANDVDTAGFRSFCQPIAEGECTGFGATTETVFIDAGLDPETGLPIDGGTTTSTSSSSVIPDAKYQCGSGGDKTSTESTATNLVNGTRYAVGVSAVDRYGNAGPISTIVCESPTPTTDFWDSYRAAGGQAGGGFCAFSPTSRTSGTLSLAALGLVIAVSRLRKRKHS